MLEIILISFGIGAFSFFWKEKFCSIDTPITGHLVQFIRWSNFKIEEKFAGSWLSYWFDKLTIALTGCEHCFAAQLSLWTGIFYFDVSWMMIIQYVGLSMLFAGITKRLIYEYL